MPTVSARPEKAKDGPEVLGFADNICTSYDIRPLEKTVLKVRRKKTPLAGCRGSLVPWLFPILVNEWAERKQGAWHTEKVTCPSLHPTKWMTRNIVQSREERGIRRRFVCRFVGYGNYYIHPKSMEIIPKPTRVSTWLISPEHPSECCRVNGSWKKQKVPEETWLCLSALTGSTKDISEWKDSGCTWSRMRITEEW